MSDVEKTARMATEAEAFLQHARGIIKHASFAPLQNSEITIADDVTIAPTTRYISLYDDEYRLYPHITGEDKLVWFAVRFVDIPGQFNPYDGGSPPDVEETELGEFTTPTEALKAVMRHLLDSRIDDYWMWDDAEKAHVESLLDGPH